MGFPTSTHMHTHTHTPNLFVMHQKAVMEPQVTALLKSNTLAFCGSYLANSGRTDVQSQFKASSLQPASSAYKLRVWIIHSPTPLFCSGLKWLSEINLIHANVPKRNARFSWQMHKVSCCHRIPQCLLSTRCQRMQIYSWLWCSFVLQIPSFTAVVFYFHVHRAKFSEVGDRPWICILMWIYVVVYLPGKCLFELNSKYIGEGVFELAQPPVLEVTLAHPSNVISFQQVLWNRCCLSDSLFAVKQQDSQPGLALPGTVEIIIITSARQNKRRVIVRKRRAVFLHLSVGAFAGHPTSPSGNDLAM